MIYPATLNIRILQNSTFELTVRALQNQKAITGLTVTNGNPIFAVPCHGLSAGDKVVVVPQGQGSASIPAAAPVAQQVPCGLELNKVYFVSATGLTAGAFTVSATNGGAAITVANEPLAGMVVAEPVDLTGYTADSDIHEKNGGVQVETFTCTLPTPADGLVRLTMAPSATVGIAANQYDWDLSLTSGSGVRYYWLQGDATVAKTNSRN